MGEAAPAVVAEPPLPATVVASTEKIALYVGDLDAEVTEEDLVCMFASFGTILSTRVFRDRCSGESLRYAYVNFASSSCAKNAFQALNHVVLKGKPVRIMWTDRNPIRRKSGVGNLFVKNLDQSIGGVELELLFRPYGQVISCKVQHDEKGGSRGFGFVQMNSEEAALSAIVALHGTIPIGACSKILYVGPAQKKVESENLIKKFMDDVNGQQLQKALGTTIYVKNLDDSISDKALQEHFALCGKILWSKAWRYKNGRSKGFGFVCFSSFEEASEAVVTLNESKLNGKHLYVAIAQHRESRFNHSHSLHSMACNCSVISHPPYYIGLTHDLASVYPPGGLYLPMGNHGFQFLPAPSFCTPQEQIRRTYFRSTDMIPHLREACHVPFNSLMHPIMVYLPQEAYYLQGRFVDDYYLKQRFNRHSRHEKVMKKTRCIQLQQPCASGVKKACSNAVPHDQQAMLSKNDTLDPQLRKSKILEFLYCNVQKLEPMYASEIANMLLQMSSTRVQEVLSKPWVLDELVKETTAKGLRVGDRVAGTTVSQLTES